MHQAGKMKLLVLILVLVGLAVTGAGCRPAKPASPPASPVEEKKTRPTTVAELATYQGADREELLLQGAQEEGKVVLYTSMALEDSEPLLEAFRKKYPKVEVSMWRASDEALAQKMISEARGGRYDVDVVESNSPGLEILGREKLLTVFRSPLMGAYPEESRDPKGLWQATRYNFFVPSYNTQLVSPQDLPRTYEELLDPKWKGKLGIEAEDYDWFATLVLHMGREKGLKFMRDLSAQGLKVRKGHTLLAELTAAGEIPLAVTTYSHSVQRILAKGAPIEWFPLEPVIARANGVALAANAPHPHAALLFIDFILSEDGQKVIAARRRVPAHPNVPADPPRLNTGFKYKLVNAEAFVDDYENWVRLWEDIIIQSRAK